jgi:hypothetical protein
MALPNRENILGKRDIRRKKENFHFAIGQRQKDREKKPYN